MFARVTVTEFDPDRIDSGIESFNSQVVPTAKAQDGFKGALLLADRAGGRGMGITLWETEDARTRAGEALDVARAATLKAMGGGAPPVDEYEVVASEL